MTSLPNPVLTNRQLNTTAAVTMNLLLGMSRDRQYLVGTSKSPYTRRIIVSSDGGNTWTAGTQFGSSPRQLVGFIETLDGELLVEVTENSSTSIVYKTTGWNWTTATCTSFTQVLETSGPGVSFRREWSFNQKAVAPEWSKMAGSILLMEYGTKVSEAVTPAQAATHAFISRDNGATWNVCFDARNYFPGSTVPLHGHGATRLVTDNAWAVWGGDGGVGCESWIYICPDEDLESGNGWELVDHSDSTSGVLQVVSGMETPSGLIFGSDSSPARIAKVARLGYRRYSALSVAAPVSRALLVASNIHQNEGQPDAPIFATFPSGSTSGPPVVYASLDGGFTWQEAHRETAGLSSGSGITLIFGPDINGKVYANYYVDGTSALITWDFDPAPVEQSSGAAVLDTRLVSTGRGLVGGGDLSADRTLQAVNAMAASRSGLLAHAFPSHMAGSASSALTAGTLYLIKVTAEESAATGTRNVRFWRVAGGSGITLARSAVFDATGTKLGSDSADQSSTWNTAGGTAVSTSVGNFAITAGTDYYIALLIVGGTGPTIGRSGNSNVTNAGLSGASLLWATNGTGLSDMPVSITPASNANQAQAIWGGLY